MRRILLTALLLVTALSAAAAAVCDCSAGCSYGVCVAPAETVFEDTSTACCAPILTGQPSVAPARTGHDESASNTGDGLSAADQAHAAFGRRINRHFEEAAPAAAIIQTGQTTYLRTGRLRL